MLDNTHLYSRMLSEELVTQIQPSGGLCIEWKHGENSPTPIVMVSAEAAGGIASDSKSWVFANGKVALAGDGRWASSRLYVE